ncbi:MAG: ABC transporter ATP-binding protein [Pseudomonadota bacterium]
MRARLALDGVAKSFGDTLAVRDMSLSLAPGEFVSLLGPSGCGKSTTLAMIAGFETPTKGAILIDGKDVARRPPGKRAIGLVFQDYAVFSRLSVRSNLLFGLEAQGVGRAERKRRLEAIVERLDLGHLLTRRGANLNMSEMQRVALARVLVTEPLLLLLDEPMSNLDAAIRERLRTELKALQQDLGQTVLYVTHDQVEAMAMSDRIAVMHDGVIEQIGTPEDIYHRPATRFVAEFIGDPPINLLPCAVTSEGNGCRAMTDAGILLDLNGVAAPEGRYLLALRPHDIAIGGTDSGTPSTVRFVERFGPEDVLHCTFNDALVTVAVAPDTAIIGEEVGLSFAPSRIHLIDEADGRVVTSKAPS